MAARAAPWANVAGYSPNPASAGYLVAPMDLEQQLRQALTGTYRIKREMGGGGMSRVFAAEELALGRTVALKVLVDQSAGVSAERFQREILTVAKLHHPHIVPLLSAGVADSAVFYTMPLVQGESLRARLHRDGQLPVSEAVAFARDVADAISSTKLPAGRVVGTRRACRGVAADALGR